VNGDNGISTNGDSGYNGGSPGRGVSLKLRLPTATSAPPLRRRAVVTISHRLAGVGIASGQRPSRRSVA